jgi:aconitase A
MAGDVKKNDYIDKISVALIGSCTNSSYEDMSRAAQANTQKINYHNDEEGEIYHYSKKTIQLNSMKIYIGCS